MKIIFLIANSPWNIRNYRMDLISDLSEKYKIYVLSSMADMEFGEHVKALWFPSLRGKFWPVSAIMCIPITLYYIILYRPNVAITFTASAGILFGYMRRLKFFQNHLSTITGMGSLFIGSRVTAKGFMGLLKSSLKKSDIVVQNKSDYKIFKKLVTTSTCIINGSGVRAPKNFKDKSIHEKITFGYVGRLISSKRTSILIEAF